MSETQRMEAAPNYHPDFGSWWWRLSEGFAWFSFAGPEYREDRRGIPDQILAEGWPAWMQTSIPHADRMGADRMMIHLPFGQSPRDQPMWFDAGLHLRGDPRFAKVVCPIGITEAIEMHWERFRRPLVWYMGAITQNGTTYEDALECVRIPIGLAPKVAVIIDAAAPNGYNSVDYRIARTLREMGVDVGVEAFAHHGTGWLADPSILRVISDQGYDNFRANQWAAWAPEWQQNRGVKMMLTTTAARTHNRANLERRIKEGWALAVGPWEHRHGRLDWTFEELRQVDDDQRANDIEVRSDSDDE